VNRDQIEAALGKVRDLQGQLWAERAVLAFCGWFGVAKWHYEAKCSILDGD